MALAITRIGTSRLWKSFGIGLLGVAFIFAISTPAHAGLLDKLTGGNKPKEQSTSEESASTRAAAAPAYSGPKQVVCVQAFEGHAELGWDEGEVLAAMLTDSLMATGRFIVVERPKLDAILKEQDLGAAGRINSQTALKIGQIVGASILIQGTVTQFDPGEKGQSGHVAVPIPGVGSIGLGGSKITSKVQIQLRTIDLTTSVVLDTYKASAEGTYKSMGMDVYAGGVSAGGDKFKKTPLGETSQKAVEDATQHIVSQMANVPFSARVADVDGKQIYINAGSNRGMKTGTVLGIYKQGKTITDPDTGLPLSVKMDKTGSIKIDEVQEKMSVCSLVDGKAPAKGDTVRLEQ